MTRPFRFAVQAARASDGPAWAELARRAEELGFAALYLPDHFTDQLAPFPAMAAAAAATTTLRVGGLVVCNDYRHPVVHAKELATLDVLSGGRVDWGIGAGWMTSDYEQAGIEKDPAGVRIERLAEAIRVMRLLFSDGRADFTGAHYRITDLDGRPKPVQKPHPPLLLGGGGRKMLQLAAAEADIVGLAPAARTGRVDTEAARDASAEATDRKVAWLREFAGERIDSIEINALVFLVVVTDDRTSTANGIAGAFGMSGEEVLESPHVWIGTVDEICDDLRRRRERWGISYYAVPQEAMEQVAPIVARLAGT
ncbi:MAG: LLM class F420-dependent oxidoreductase [Acidimicrobiales bacterium]|nr:MAG: LLM class F420-dependent oxidoreductase [Acidimicrobiales bacterium]